MLGNGHEGLARGVHCFSLVALSFIETALPLGNASLLAKADDRVLRDVEAGADVRYGDASRVEISDVGSLGRGERSELDPMRQARHSGTLITGSKVRRQARDQVKERLPLFREGVGEGHHKRLTRNITQVNVGAALREFLLEGFLVAGELGGGGVGGRLVGVSAAAGGCAGGAAARGCRGACLVGMAGGSGTAVDSGCGDRTDGAGAGGDCTGSRLVGVSAVTADVGAVVALAAMSVPASTLVAVIVPAVVIALVAAVLGVAVVPAGVFAAVPVLF